MEIRLATYNVNNLFRRASIMELEGFNSQTADVLTDADRLRKLLAQDSYAGATGAEIVALLEKYDFHTQRQQKNPWFAIVEAKQKLYKVKRDTGSIELVAKGRASWLGWIELIREGVHQTATENTGRVIKAVDADVLCVVEVEDRLTLDRFNNTILKKLKATYDFNLLVDGNDLREIDVGLFSRFPITSVRSHIHDTYKTANGQFERVFSRDCPEFEVALPGGKTLWMLCNHFKSKGYGAPAQNDRKRAHQAKRVCDLLARMDLKKDLVVVAGDLNDSPVSQPLQKLIGTPDLHDVLAHPAHTGPRWTYQSGGEQIDYLLVSTPLYNAINSVGIERRGIFSATNFGGQFPHFPEVASKTTQASDHAAVWAEFTI